MPWPPSARQPRNILRRLRGAALAAIAVLVAASSLASFGESYHALYLWAGHHDFGGFWAAIWPLLIDTFIAIGELAVFVAMVDNWPLRHRLSAWLVTALGLAGSVAANIGHVATPDLSTRATAAVPPLAAATSLWVGTGVLKRIVSAPCAPLLDVQELRPADEGSFTDCSGDLRFGDGDIGGQRSGQRRSTTTRTTPGIRERAMQLLAANPGLTNAQVAKRTGASERTITRARQDLARG
jgi:hypothetical protein